MLKRRVLLLGASGYLGTEIHAKLREDGSNEIVGTCFSCSSNANLVCLDVTDSVQFGSLLDRVVPDVVIWSLMSAVDEQQLIGKGGLLPSENHGGSSH